MLPNEHPEQEAQGDPAAETPAVSTKKKAKKPELRDDREGRENRRPGGRPKVRLTRTRGRLRSRTRARRSRSRSRS